MNIKKNIYNIISILTLVVMVLGSTFAYFTTSQRSSDKAINVSALDIRMDLKIIPLYNGVNLLPTNDTDIDRAFQGKCLDSCQAYTIEISNKGQAQDINGTFSIETDKLVNLKFKVLDQDNNNEIYKDITSVNIEPQSLGNTIHLNSNETKKLILIIWLSNLNEEQNNEQLGYFKGTISLNSVYGAKLTGTISN